MTDFDVNPERITVFRVGSEYLFKHYFEREDVFQQLESYYNRDEYRFEVPADEFGDVETILEDAYYEPVVVTDLEPFCVVKPKYTPHADILRNSVAHWSRNGYNFFLVTDELSVREAIEAGAEPVGDTEFVIGL